MRQGLWDVTAPLRERRGGLPVKWVRPANIHLSLKFLGEVEESREPELHAALKQASGAGIDTRALTLQIEGFGVFPHYRRPNVLWAGVAPDPALELLQHRVEQAFAPLGFPTEARTFRPHVTLARARRDATHRDFTGLEEQLQAIAFSESCAVSGVDLMQSTLQADGPVYQVQHHERLS